MASQESLSSSSLEYDVFVSFRGIDTRLGFIGLLRTALEAMGIRPFIDEEIPRGKKIKLSLNKAIEKSKIAIIVLSKNYASSSFCLNELVHILISIKKKGLLVLPVFYDVDPSDVRHQRGSYEKAFATHEQKFKDDMKKVGKWRTALRRAANLAGFPYKSGNENESEFIKKIVKEISKKINRLPIRLSSLPIILMQPRKEEQQPKNETEKKADDGRTKKHDGPAPVVYKLHCVCEGCVRLIKQTIRDFDGVETHKVDPSANKLTVTGKMDSNKLRDKLADKTNKNVEIVSPQPKTDASAAAKKPPKKSDEKKTDDKKPEENEPEEKEEQQPKNETEKKADDGRTKKHDGPAPVVYKLHCVCEGCVNKIKQTIRYFGGVETHKVDPSANKLTVTGKMDSNKLRDKLADITEKNVEIVSPSGHERRLRCRRRRKLPEKMSDEKKPDDKKPEEHTVVLKIRLDCDGCVTEFRRIIRKFQGDVSVNPDLEKDLVTVKGTIDEKKLVTYLKKKLNRHVEVVPPK